MFSRPAYTPLLIIQAKRLHVNSLPRPSPQPPDIRRRGWALVRIVSQTSRQRELETRVLHRTRPGGQILRGASEADCRVAFVKEKARVAGLQGCASKSLPAPRLGPHPWQKHLKLARTIPSPLAPGPRPPASAGYPLLVRVGPHNPNPQPPPLFLPGALLPDLPMCVRPPRRHPGITGGS